jgi:L-malate glycosyltransferase
VRRSSIATGGPQAAPNPGALRALFYGDVPHRIAGGQKSLLTAVLKAREFGLDPVMVFPGEGAFEKKCRAEGLRVRLSPGPPSFNVFGKALLRKSLAAQLGVIIKETLPYARDLARLIDEERADVVHYNTARGMILAGWGAHLAGRNAVMHQRGSVAIGRLYWLAAQALADWILLVARALLPEVFPSARGRASVLYNGVDASLPIVPRLVAREAIARKVAGATARGPGSAFATDAETPLFVSLSSPAPFKGLHYLLDAAAIARDRGVKATYILAGEPKPGGYQVWLSNKLDALGLRGTVLLAGFVEDTHELLCAADALILPSVEHERIEAGGEVFEDRSNEGLPRSILEAMAAGVPSIASDIAGVSEQIEDGKEGLLVPPKSAPCLADAIERMARDPAFREAAGRASLETVKTRFRIEDAARGLVEALAHVAAQPSGIATKALRWPALVADALRVDAPRAGG